MTAISNQLAKSKIVLNCTTNLSQLNLTHKIILRWIKAHARHEGNKRADYLAKQGTTLLIPNPPRQINP